MAEDVAKNLDTRRYHGLVAQDVRDALASLDINYDDFAGLNMTNENHYGLNYDEFIPICVNAVQTQLSQLDELELRVNKLEELM